MNGIRNILYIHGMGGGRDSRIPSILKECFEQDPTVNIIIRTYDFDPDLAWQQISAWVEAEKPALVIGESMGSIHALRIKGVPHLFVSPAINAPIHFRILAPLTLIPGVTWLLDRIYKPRPGERQPLHFTWKVLRKWGKYRRLALANSPRNGGKDYFYAFLGRYDHYRKSGVVRITTWRKYYGEKSYTIYPGTHFMEEEFVRTMLVEKIRKVIDKKF
ncbi:MAG: hypothetical protein K5984_03415 [Bacteroidales bacterium]|nr:hypothetical protein [Bacteroidales bacterium]